MIISLIRSLLLLLILLPQPAQCQSLAPAPQTLQEKYSFLKRTMCNMDVLNVIGLFSDACRVIKYKQEFDRKLQQAPHIEETKKDQEKDIPLPPPPPPLLRPAPT
ncbi:hypothetical protein MP638_007276 [Amoeboaphelidium occidentale]|nr:hypothetical protein MP638_007276 [Amoeboaphelidium occidentale]